LVAELITNFPIQGITTIMGIILIITTMSIITMANKVKIIIKGLLIMEITTVSTSTWTRQGVVARTGRVLLGS